MESGIYKITINNDFYIGSATSLRQRKNRHLFSLRKGNHCNKIMQRHFDKYGENNFCFEVIEYCEKNKLIEREQYYINVLNPKMNICKIAGSSFGVKHSKETKELLSKKFKGMQRSLGRKMSEETKNKIAEKAKQRGISKNCMLALQKYREEKHPQSKEVIRKRSLGRLKLSHEQIKEVYNMIQNGATEKQLTKLFNVSNGTIWNIKNKNGIYCEIIDS